MRFCKLLMVLCLFSVVVSGCTKPPPAPTAEEAAKTPPLPPPKGADNARSVSD